MTNCKHMTNERTCGLKSNAYRHRCYGEDKCRHCKPMTKLRAADGANAAARVKKPRAPKMTCDEMLQNLKSIAKEGDRQ